MLSAAERKQHIMSLLKRSAKIAASPVTSLFYWISGLIPRNANTWIFGSYSNAFNDNSKYLFIQVTENHPNLNAIWITGNQEVRDSIRRSGGKAHLRWSLRGVIACLSGMYWFCSGSTTDINYYCSRKATLVNLWHGIPLKKIEFDIRHGPLAQRFHGSGAMARNVLTPATFRRPEFVLSTSGKVTEDSLASAFRVEPQQCLAFGYPRTDHFFKPATERMRLIQKWDPPNTDQLIAKITTFQQCIIYMPTWRDSNPHFITDSGWDFPTLNESLRARNMLLLLKLHVATPLETLRSAENLSNIHVMKPTEDVYGILPFTSSLITDYSSIMFDYLLLDKPIYYYPFDRPAYESDSRGFYYSYKDCIGGQELQSPNEIVDLRIGDDKEKYARARRDLREQFFDHLDSDASERIVRYFSGLATQSRPRDIARVFGFAFISFALGGGAYLLSAGTSARSLPGSRFLRGQH
jgi:CDP-glycerol glycerophosphotransferase (TagB/SpsB family)